jgi:aconitate hydratase
LVLAYGLAGSFDEDIAKVPLGHTSDGEPITLQDIWPGDEEVGEVENEFATSTAFERGYREVDLVLADARRRFQSRSLGTQFGWDETSTYVRRPPYWGLSSNARPGRMEGLRPLVILGDHITTDHISPTGTILPHSATGKYLSENGVEFADFNSYGSRRGNFEAAQRATFASPRLRNEMLADGEEGPTTLLEPDNCRTTVYEAAQQYARRGVGLVVIAGKNYGSGSSRDWAAKGPRLLGVRVVIAESFERIHRQNLAAVGILPLEFAEGHDRRSLGLSASSVIDVLGVDDRTAPRERVMVRAHREDGSVVEFPTISRLDTSEDVAYFGAGGILAQLKAEILYGQPGTSSKLEAAQ